MVMQSVQTRPAPERPVRSAGAHAVLRVLADWGIDVVLTCPGSTEGALLDLSREYPGIRVVLATHESVAVAAADGFARACGRPAVAYLHTNVGLANGIAHLSCAQRAGTGSNDGSNEQPSRRLRRLDTHPSRCARRSAGRRLVPDR